MNNFQPIKKNPYIVGNPIDDSKMFFGREQNFQELRQHIDSQGAHVLLLVAGRRSGKTSLLKEIQRGRLQDLAEAVFVDFHALTPRLNQDEDLPREIGEAILKNPVFQSLTAEFRSGKINWTTQLIWLVDCCLEIIQPRCLLLLGDEFESVEEPFKAERLTSKGLLWARPILDQSVFFIMTGSHDFESQMVREALSHSSSKMNIQALADTDAENLIQRPVAGQLTYSNEVVRRMLRLSGNQPFFVQLICQTLVIQNNALYHHAEIVMEDLEDTLRHLIKNSHGHIEETWKTLVSGGRGKNEQLICAHLFLAALAHTLEDAEGYVEIDKILATAKDRHFSLSKEKVYNTVAWLREKKSPLLEVHDVRDAYRFQIDLFRHWIAYKFRRGEDVKAYDENLTDNSHIEFTSLTSQLTSIPIPQPPSEEGPARKVIEKKRGRVGYIWRWVGMVTGLLLVAVLTWWLFFKPQPPVTPPPPVTSNACGSDCYAGIEIGPKGIKAVVLKPPFPERPKMESPLLFKESRGDKQPNPFQDVLQKRQIEVPTLDNIVFDIAGLLKKIRGEHQVAQEHIYVVASSDLAGAKNKDQLMERVKIQTSKGMEFLNPDAEVCPSLKRVIESYEASAKRTLLIYLGSATIKACHQEMSLSEPTDLFANGGNLKYSELNRYGTLRFSAVVDNKSPYQNSPEKFVNTAQAFWQNGKTLLASTIRQFPSLTERDQVYLTGGIVWAMMTYLKPPGKSKRNLVEPIHSGAIDTFYQMVTETPEQVHDAHPEDEMMNKVRNTFSSADLIAGAQLLKGLSDELSFSKKEVFFWNTTTSVIFEYTLAKAREEAREEVKK